MLTMAYHPCKVRPAIQCARGFARILPNASRRSAGFIEPPPAQQVIPPCVLFGGVQTSGDLHIGNLLGSIYPFVQAQEAFAQSGHRSFFVLADQHSLHDIMIPKADSLIDPWVGKHSRNTLALLIACGVDPHKSTLFLQSQIPMVFEMMWTLTCITSLNHMKTDPLFRGPNTFSTTASNTLYPVLMAADILSFRSTHVVIGEDMSAHLTFARSSATKFNTLFRKELFPDISIYPKTPLLINNLHNSDMKMSKSDPVLKNKVNLLDTPEMAHKKIIKSKTDSDGDYNADPRRKELRNLAVICAGCRKVPISTIDKQYDGVPLPVFKRELADTVCLELAKIQENFHDIMKEEGFLNDVIELGKLSAREAAQPTIRAIKEGLGYFTLH